MFRPQPSFVSDEAYRRGWEKGLAAYNPERVVTVNISCSSAAADRLSIPPLTSIRVQQYTPIRDVLAEIYKKLPADHPTITITASGPPARELSEHDNYTVMSLLPKYDATMLMLRLAIPSQRTTNIPPSKGLGSRLRQALTRRRSGSTSSNDNATRAAQDRNDAARSQPTLWAAPPRYKETATPEKKDPTAFSS